jgi:hypothetical protein
MEVLGMAGKLLRNISPDKIENHDVEYYKQALDLTGCTTITAVIILSLHLYPLQI